MNMQCFGYPVCNYISNMWDSVGNWKISCDVIRHQKHSMKWSFNLQEWVICHILNSNFKYYEITLNYYRLTLKIHEKILKHNTLTTAPHQQKLLLNYLLEIHQHLCYNLPYLWAEVFCIVWDIFLTDEAIEGKQTVSNVWSH